MNNAFPIFAARIRPAGDGGGKIENSAPRIAGGAGCALRQPSTPRLPREIMKRKVYLDECGNTGQDLFNAADPIFVLSSCRFEPEQERLLLQVFSDFQGPELKFSRLRKSPKGERMVLEFLESHLVTSDSVAVFVIHKPFMVVCKYCDLVLEPSMQQAEVDFYKDGLNLATANLLTTTMPVLLNPHTWHNFLAAFVRVVRERSLTAFREWVCQAELIYSYFESSDRGMAHWFSPVLLLKDNPDAFLATLGEHELDPLVTSYYTLANHWSLQLTEPFEICADESKPLLKERVRLIALSAADLRPVTVGYDRRKMSFPFKSTTVTSADSKAERQVQLADVIAGAAAACFKSKARFVPDSFLNRVMKAFLNKKLVIDGMWPSKDITPEALGTVSQPNATEIDLPTYMGLVMRGDPKTKRQI